MLAGQLTLGMRPGCSHARRGKLRPCPTHTAFGPLRRGPLQVEPNSKANTRWEANHTPPSRPRLEDHRGEAWREEGGDGRGLEEREARATLIG